MNKAPAPDVVQHLWRSMRLALLLLVLALGCTPNPNVSGVNPSFSTRPPAQKPAEPAPPKSAAADPDDLPPLPNMGPSAGETPDEFFQKGRLAEALLLLETARRSHPDRIEAYYNEGLLLLAYAPLFGGDEYIKAVVRAKRLLTIFVERAASSPEYADGVGLAKARLQDIEDATVCHFGPEAERKQRDEAEKQRRALEEEP